MVSQRAAGSRAKKEKNGAESMETTRPFDERIPQKAKALIESEPQIKGVVIRLQQGTETIDVMVDESSEIQPISRGGRCRLAIPDQVIVRTEQLAVDKSIASKDPSSCDIKTGKDFTRRAPNTKSKKCHRNIQDRYRQHTSTTLESCVGPAQRVADLELNERQAPPCTEMRSFKVSEENMVKNYLLEKFVELQQQANKKIAKGWIKGICPKKQSLFPYTNNQRFQREGLDPEIPDWWPRTGCEFKEPDHIVREHRMALCMHLLRLRPDFEQFAKWTGYASETGPRITFETQGWTAFLRELTPASLFDGLDPDKPERRIQRLKLLTDLFDIAEKEERFLEGECDGEDMVHWEPERTVTGKRSREASVHSRGEDGSTSFAPAAGRRAKAAKKANDQTLFQEHSRLTSKLSNMSLAEGPSENVGKVKVEVDTLPSDAEATGLNCQFSPVQTCNANQMVMDTRSEFQRQSAGQIVTSRLPQLDLDAPRYPVVKQEPLSMPDTPIDSMIGSFSSVHSTAGNMYDAHRSYEAPTMFPGKQDSAFPRCDSSQGIVQVHYAQNLPQPQFDTVPNSPVFSAPSAIDFSRAHDPYANNAYGVPEVTYAAGNQRYQKNNDGTWNPPAPVADPVPSNAMFVGSQYPSLASNSQGQSQDMAYGFHSPFHLQVQNHGLPTGYTGETPIPHYDVPQPQVDYQESRPEMCFPAAPLPGRVIRGFTGHGSGIGGGAWV